MMTKNTTMMAFLAVLTGASAVQEAVQVSQADAVAFVDEQFSYYFTDCQKFVDTFTDNFEYCDFAPGIKTKKTGCMTKKEDLLEACLETQGAPTTIYQLDPQPVFTGTLSSYNEVAIKGYQKVNGVPSPGPDGQVVYLNMCFDLVIVEDLEEAPEHELGVKSSFWKGYFSVELCDIPGLPECICNSLTPLVSYNQ